jgi:hypothetical protein
LTGDRAEAIAILIMLGPTREGLPSNGRLVVMGFTSIKRGNVNALRSTKLMKLLRSARVNRMVIALNLL